MDLNRQFEPDLAIRADGTGRTISGIVVPFDRVARVSDGGPSYQEKFRQGAFTKTIRERGDRVKLLSQHQSKVNPLGRATSLREDSSGLYGEFKVSRTSAGDEALELVRDGALDSFSVGFAPIQSVKEKGVTVRTEVALREASLVTFPAYADARILAVRHTLDEIAAMTTDERAALIAALSQELAVTSDEADGPGTPDGAAAADEPTASHSRHTWKNNFRATLIEKGII